MFRVMTGTSLGTPPRTDAVRAGYLENRRRHFKAIRRECLASEIYLEEFTTNEPLDRALHYFIHRRNHALLRSSVRRRRALGGAD